MSKSRAWFQLRNDHLREIIHVKSLLSVVLLTQTAFGQGQDADKQITTSVLWPYVKPHTLEDPSFWSADAEYLANWGLSLVGFHAAYAVGAFGQNIKVGVLDDGTWSGHDEFKTRNNVKGFSAPFDGAEIPGISSSGKLLNHGLHVAGIIGANRDSKGMHGGAFLSTIYAGVGAGVGSKLTEPGAAEAVIKSGVDFLNNSWGNNFQRTIRYPSTTSNAGTISEYAVPISVEVDGSLRTLQHGPDIYTSDRLSRHLLPGSRMTMHTMLDIARSGAVNVFATGNDIYATSLFRGISPSPLTVTLPNVLASGHSWLENDVSTSGDTYRRLNSRMQFADIFSSDIKTYRGILRDVDGLDAETQRDPRVVLLAEKLRLLIGPVGDKDTGFEKRKQLNSNTAWRETEPESLLPLRKLSTDFLGIASLTDGDLETYLVNAKGQLDRLDPVEKLHASVITFQTELANLAASNHLYKLGKFEPSNDDRAFLLSVRTQDDFRQIEKHWLTVANLSNDETITSNSNICGPSKYYCVSAPGGSYSQAPGVKEVNTPDVPAGLSIFDQHGKALKGKVPAFDYQIFSLGITSGAAAGSTNAEKQAKPKSAYQLMGGTSMAAPHATAGLAVIKSRFPYLENSQVRDTLLSTAKDIGAQGIDRVYGWGLMDLAKAMGGPAKLWQLKKDYDLTFAEQRAAQKYNPIVAQAGYYEVAAPIANFLRSLKNRPLLSAHNRVSIEINRLMSEGNAANVQAKSAHEKGDLPAVIRQSALAEAKFSEARAKIEEAYRIAEKIKKNDAIANEAQDLVRANELTRDHPNEPEDTLSAAFEYFNFRVNIPGARTAECDSQACIADYWTNDIDGPGGLTKLGKGALALTGDNTYKGATRIENGVLQLGMGGPRGGVVGNIVNNSILAFHRSDEYVFPGVISGTGSLETYGGTLRLKGNNTYGGDTNVNGGLLAVDGRIASRVNVNHGGRLGGFGRIGSLVVKDGGALALGASVGTLTVSDDVRFEPGSLYDVKIAGDMNSSDRLQVLGAVELFGGTVSVRMDGDANPLDQVSAQTLFSRKYDIITAQRGVKNTFEGVTPQYNYITALLDYKDKNKVVLKFDLTQEAKSEEARKKQAELEARERELAGLTATPKVEAPAPQLPAVIEPSTSPAEAVAEVQPKPAPPVAILYQEPDPRQPPMEPAKSADARAAARLEADVQRRTLELQDLRFRELNLLGATTLNQKHIGESLKSFGVMSRHPLVEGLLGTKAGDIPDYDSLTGEMHATLSGVLPNDSRFVARVALNRLQMRFAEPLLAEYSLIDSPLLADLSPGRGAFAFAPGPKDSIFWTQAYGGRTNAIGDGNASGYDSSSGGFVLGVDGFASNQWRVGLLASLGSMSVKTGTGRASIDNYRLGVYGGMQLQGIGLRLGANIAWHQIDTKRQAHWFDLTENNEASYSAMSTELYGEFAYTMVTPVAVFEPFIGVSHVKVRTDKFKEDGAITGLAGSSTTTHTSVVTTGLHAFHKVKPNDATTLTVRGMLGWSQAFGDTSPEASLGIMGADRYHIQGLPMARERTTVELGLDAEVGDNASLGVAYRRQFAGAITDSAVEANVQYRF